eukprot:6182111-Pleurochrysis_carterae.AAC.3
MLERATGVSAVIAALTIKLIVSCCCLQLNDIIESHDEMSAIGFHMEREPSHEINVDEVMHLYTILLWLMSMWTAASLCSDQNTYVDEYLRKWSSSCSAKAFSAPVDEFCHACILKTSTCHDT